MCRRLQIMQKFFKVIKTQQKTFCILQ